MLIFIHTIAIVVFAIAVIGKPLAVQHVVIGGTLVVTAAVAYVLCRGWLTWGSAEARRAGLPVPA